MAEAATPPVQRRLAHTRQIVCQGFHRDDGLIDIDGRLTDLTADTAVLRFHTVPAGGEIHDMRLVMTLDTDMRIHHLRATSLAAATPWCAQGDGRYAVLEGLRIGPGFRRAVRERVGGVQGCTHLTELVSAMALTAAQTVLAMLRDRQDTKAFGDAQGKPHWIIDSCHAFRRDGDAARKLVADLQREADQARAQPSSINPEPGGPHE